MTDKPYMGMTQKQAYERGEIDGLMLAIQECKAVARLAVAAGLINQMDCAVGIGTKLLALARERLPQGETIDMESI